MIINTKTTIVAMAIILAAGHFGLRFVRAFALSIAEENHGTNLEMDNQTERLRLKREQEADAALASAVAKVAPLLPNKASQNAQEAAPLQTV
mmetsp:Transcript_47559/g.70411  ORF Transcript_47559/g.70411 Transcript_47559/m.70411 type:complete len:92 (-) Transcript_47559:317-592(-)|eukprot:CAMPEP_0195523748 /NCGR_PEP_ID=MMETSP0794_2-20130614/23151_1 /TAXON_ID=515487 /ORGANISM="Stephanopyxis turris, Strain CCMP 815" /LENGTH=91 /DNA_ID=CAMNT_0040653817 /DNA_START=179 /DNA_END=454 /DNA_ORIENTATION=-